MRKTAPRRDRPRTSRQAGGLLLAEVKLGRATLRALEDVPSLVPNGSHIVIGGFADTINPMAIVRALVAHRVGDLELTAVAEAWSAEFLVAAGLVRKVRMSNLMFEGLGRCRAVSRAIESGAVEVEDYSHFGLISRLVAAAEGLPFAAVRSMMETSLETVTTFQEPKGARFEDPFFKETVYLVPRAEPDIALIHAARADEDGNIQLFGPNAVIQDQARAARRVIVSVEEIVPNRVTRAAPSLTVVPGFLVDTVVWAPFGAHPTGLYGYYGADRRHLEEYYEASRSESGTNEYLERHIWSVKGDHWEYLRQIGQERMNRLRADPYWGYPSECAP
jgi:glutaconate CoA-transferase, subunit A